MPCFPSANSGAMYPDYLRVSLLQQLSQLLCCPHSLALGWQTQSQQLWVSGLHPREFMEKLNVSSTVIQIQLLLFTVKVWRECLQLDITIHKWGDGGVRAEPLMIFFLSNQECRCSTLKFSYRYTNDNRSTLPNKFKSALNCVLYLIGMQTVV